MFSTLKVCLLQRSFFTWLLWATGLSLVLMAASAVFATSVSANSYSLGAIPKPTVTLPAPGLLPSQQTFFALSGPPISTKKVFAHYMVCCGFKGPSGSIAADEEEIIMAQTMGMNGFALNVGAWSSNTTYRTAVANMFAAAADLNSGFVLFFSADMTGLGATDVVSMMKAYANNPYYFKYNGQPVLSTFYGQSNTNSSYTTPSEWWTNLVLNPLKAQGINSFFVPGFQDVAPYPNQTSSTYLATYVAGQVAQWQNLVQGLMTWQALSVINNDAGDAVAVPIINSYASSLGKIGKAYMPGIVAKYWGSVQNTNGNIYYEWQGGSGMDAQWQAAITSGAPWVEILTWNDFNESYIMPMDDFEKYCPWGFPTGFTKSSLGYAELLRYYIAWFRTGVRPAITRDAIFWFYRTHPAAAVAQFAALPTRAITGPVTRYVPSSNGSGKVPTTADQIFVTAFGVSSASLSINSSVKNVAAGINQFSVPFVAGRAPIFQLVRGSALVMKTTGADAIQSSPPYYDWWNSSGFIEGPSTTAAGL
jgi:glucan endo-1,3-alpha-glucosidase